MNDHQPTILAFDSGSKTLSVALSAGGRILDDRQPQSRSSVQLPRLAGDLLADAALGWRDLDGIVAARGPGSFTGLRVGLAFALGLHQALAIPATAISTLQLLAAASGLDRPLTVAVNAWRDSWFVQHFAEAGVCATDPQRVATSALTELAGPVVLSEPVDDLPTATVAENSVALAALELAGEPDFAWRPQTLQRPLYLAPPPANLPAATGTGQSRAAART